MIVFFDVDGVLIDGWHCNPDRRIPWDLTIERDLGIRREALQQGLFQRQSDGSGSLMQACVSGRLDLKEVLTELLPALGYDGGADAFVDYWFTKDSRINSDVLDAVERLGNHTGVDVYLATGQEHHRAAYLWNELGLSRHFRDMFYSARLGRLKGTPEFFSEINRILKIGPDERPVFFDDQDKMVRIAQDAGWDACVLDSIQDILQHPRLRQFLNG